jgi:hypothetical protein
VDVYSPDVAAHIGEELLPDFVHSDRVYRMRDLAGRCLHELGDILELTQHKEGPERRLEVDRYIGDFVLFMGGFFPTAIRRNRWLTPEPMVSRVGGILVSFSQPLDYYVAEGKNAYSRAAATARYVDPTASSALRQLGLRFEAYLQVVARVKSLIVERDPGVGDLDEIIA